MTDLLKYDIFMCLYAKRRKKGEKELSQAYFGFMFGSKKMIEKKTQFVACSKERNVLHAPIVWCQQTLKKAFI
jgi:hypothetical protein